MEVLNYLKFLIIGNPTKIVIAPRSRKTIEIFATGTSVQQQKKISILDYLVFFILIQGTIGNALEPLLYFELHEAKNDTFTINKKDIYICLQNAEDDLNTLVFVFLHELSHVKCKNSQQHDDLFIATFANLKNKAITMNYYKKEYRTSSRIFCGKQVDLL